jgi:hypothetical protein
MKTQIIKIMKICSALAFLTGCSSIDAKIYSENKPKMDIRNYLNGNLEAQGILQDRSGKVIKTFSVKMVGSWDKNNGKLVEDFIFSDGKKERRIWEINFTDDHNFTAKAHDTVGIAKGQQYGNALKMDYVLRIDVDSRKLDVRLIDWIYLLDEKNAINVSKMKKFGFTVGTLSIAFKKL